MADATTRLFGTLPGTPGAVRAGRRRSPRRLARAGAAERLVASGRLDPAEFARHVALARRQELGLEDQLLRRGLVSPQDMAEARAESAGLVCVDLDISPPDPELRAYGRGEDCLRLGFLPWRRDSAGPVIAIADPDRAEEVQAALSDRLARPRFIVAREDQIRRHAAALNATELAGRALVAAPRQESCRSLSPVMVLPLPIALASAVVVATLLFPETLLLGLLAFSLVVLLANSGLRALGIAAWVRLRRRGEGRPGAGRPPALPERLPVVSLLVPLNRETEVLRLLVERLARIDYPPELLDICLILESEDDATRAALGTVRLPPGTQVIIVPPGPLQTKPRALNFALPFARGSVIGIYDAEDAPDPDQIARVVAHLAAAPPDVACVQARLEFYNAERNWLTRCFALDYAAWFGVLLPGLQSLGAVIPLGGTSVFFRRAALEAVGAWDAYNVTEDADLGLRLARRGWRCLLVDSATAEEAVSQTWPWVRQRSRWQKGFILTWVSHLRDPARMWAELGPWRFLGVQVLFLGGILAALTAPVLWGLLATLLGLPLPGLSSLPPAGLWAIGALLLLAQTLFLASSVLAANRPGLRHLIPWAITLNFYYALATVAVYKALLEIALRPFWWDKTDHDGAGNAPARALTAARRERPRHRS